MRLAVFVSGGGTNFQAILDAIAEARLDARAAVCISSRPNAAALDRARAYSIPTAVLHSDRRDEDAVASEMMSLLADHDIDFIALAGFMRMIPARVVAAFRNRLLNVHPALLPAFGGPGMYGDRVHASVIEHGARFSGATVHLVDEQYDTGPIVLQDVVRVREDDTPGTLAARVLKVEHRIYPEALQLFATRRIRVDGRRVIILPAASAGAATPDSTSSPS